MKASELYKFYYSGQTCDAESNLSFSRPQGTVVIVKPNNIRHREACEAGRGDPSPEFAEKEVADSSGDGLLRRPRGLLAMTDIFWFGFKGNFELRFLQKKKVCGLFLLIALSLFPFTAAANPVIVEVTGPKSGVKAWLVEDHTLPLISMQFSFRGGVEQDPHDKQGLGVLMAGLLTQGAGPYDDRAFQERLAARVISLSIDAQRDFIVGEIKTLRRAKDEAFKLLSLALTAPRFDEAAFERLRAQQVTAVKAQLANPAWQARLALYQGVFGDHPYGSRALGTPTSLASLTRADAAALARGRLAKDTLYVSVVGAITKAQLAAVLDRTFGALPAHAQLAPPPLVTWPSQTMTTLVHRAGTQTTILFAAPMLFRADPDWQPAEVANYILGGGGFSSRLMKAVRDKEGLTYGIDTSLVPMEKASMLLGQISADNDKTARALRLLKEVWRAFYEDGPSEDEVTAAKDFLTGAQPLALSSTGAIAGVALSMQENNLGRDFLDRREGLIRAVTRDDVRRVIRKWFNPDGASYALAGEPDGVDADSQREMTKE